MGKSFKEAYSGSKLAVEAKEKPKRPSHKKMEPYKRTKVQS